MHGAECLLVLVTLAPLVAQAAFVGNEALRINDLKTTSHVCQDGGDNERVCTFKNLILFRGRFLYLSDEDVEIPVIPSYRPGPWDVKRIKVEILSLAKLQRALSRADNSMYKRLTWAALAFRMHSENWGHHMLDITPTLHRVMCGSPLKLCTYNKHDLSKTWLVFFDSRPRHTGGFERTWACYSGNPPIYANDEQDSHYNQVLVLGHAVVGWVWGSLIYDYSWQHAQAGSLYHRVWACLGLKPSHTAKDLNQARMTIVQRPYAESSKGRSFLNAAEAVEQVKLKYPHVLFEVVVLDHLTFDKTVQLFHNSTIVVHVNGAAMGNMMFMRKGSVFVDVAPGQWYFGMVPAVAVNMKDHLQVTIQTYTNWHTHHNPVRWEVVAGVTKFKDLTRSEMVRALRDHECPSGMASYCNGHIIYTKSDFVMTPDLLQRILREGLKSAGVAALPEMGWWQGGHPAYPNEQSANLN